MFFRMIQKSKHTFLPFCHNAHVWQTDRRTDRQTDGQTEFSSLDRVCIPCSAVIKQIKRSLMATFLTLFLLTAPTEVEMERGYSLPCRVGIWGSFVSCSSVVRNEATTGGYRESGGRTSDVWVYTPTGSSGNTAPVGGSGRRSRPQTEA